jgi:1-aminocyclopropane-1-carboxylate deaminase/D-cysteine desulfhydrase-like pyridoxal-dependent ACC family enzyme
MLKYFDTPVLEISDKVLAERGVKLFVKREDMNHPYVAGNKWWKLKYNLEAAKKLGYSTVLTFGGSFSNHVYATAAATRELGLKSIGVIRGEEVLPLNTTLDFAKQSGMVLHYVSREDYRKKTEPNFIDRLKKIFGDVYLIPEGGSNELAVRGCAEFASEKLSALVFDFVCLPVGTGGTMAGIIAGLAGKKTVIGFSVLKNGDFLKEDVKKLVSEFSGKEFSNWRIETEYHFGGYAKKTNELDQFISRMEREHLLPLEFVYSAKMVFGVLDLVSKNRFPKGSQILLLHTGGLRN